MIVLDAPEATAVFLDGVAVGVAPIAPVVVPAGVHRVLFKHPTLGERVTVVDVKAGETNLADMQLGRDAGAGRAAHRVHPSGEKRLVLP